MSLGAILCLLGVASLLIIDVTGHSLKYMKYNTSNHSQLVYVSALHDEWHITVSFI